MGPCGGVQREEEGVVEAFLGEREGGGEVVVLWGEDREADRAVALEEVREVGPAGVPEATYVESAL